MSGVINFAHLRSSHGGCTSTREPSPEPARAWDSAPERGPAMKDICVADKGMGDIGSVIMGGDSSSVIVGSVAVTMGIDSVGGVDGAEAGNVGGGVGVLGVWGGDVRRGVGGAETTGTGVDDSGETMAGSSGVGTCLTVETTLMVGATRARSSGAGV